ncbi:hypothetical protein GZL_00558 [Streptomyces sp. 769]|nr:hypothetical protein GZL_00558 [Streptomyces sp. 769]
MRERPIWEAEIPLEVIRGAALPILVICGTWQRAPAAYREHVEPAAVNAALREFWG